MRVLALSLRQAGAEVRTLCLNPRKHHIDPVSLPVEARVLRVEAIDVDTSVTLAGALKSLFRGTSYNVDRFYTPSFEQRLREVVREERPDVVLLESLFMVPYVPALREATEARLVLRSVNVEHEIWQGLARSETGCTRRLVLGGLARRLRAFELATLNDVDAIVTVTPEDAATYGNLGAKIPVHVAPVGIDTDDYSDRSGHGDPLTLVFLGSLDWRPNIEAVRWFLESTWPIVKQSVPGARFLLGGSNPPAALEGLPQPEGVRVLGRVPDAREFLASGTAMVVPLLSGGGMRVKILEAMALGIPVISTKLGAAGIGARDGSEILLADDPGALAAACVNLLLDATRAATIGRAGRQYIHEVFDAAKIGRRLFETLENEVRRPRPA